MNSQHIIIEKHSNTAATVSFLLALIGFVFSLIPILGWISLPLWVLAIIFGIAGLFKKYYRGMAIAGISVGIFTFVYKIVFLQSLFG